MGICRRAHGDDARPVPEPADDTPARRDHVVAGIDLAAEMERLARLPVFGGPDGPLARRCPLLRVRRASARPRSSLGFAIPAEWRISVTAYPGVRRGDVEETLLHELVHLFVGEQPGRRRWHGREFRRVMRRAMREGFGVRGIEPGRATHGAYADALEHRRRRARGRGRIHLDQLAFDV